MKRALTALPAVLLAAATLTACGDTSDDCTYALPAPAPQIAPERPSGGTSGGSRSSGSRSTSKGSNPSKSRPTTPKNTTTSGGAGGTIHLDTDDDCDD